MTTTSPLAKLVQRQHKAGAAMLTRLSLGVDGGDGAARERKGVLGDVDMNIVASLPNGKDQWENDKVSSSHLCEYGGPFDCCFSKNHLADLFVRNDVGCWQRPPERFEQEEQEVEEERCRKWKQEWANSTRARFLRGSRQARSGSRGGERGSTSRRPP